MLRPIHAIRIKKLVYRRAEMSGVKIFEYANSGNHLHLLVRATSKDGFKRFLRTITGIIARRITGAVKGRATGKFWDELAYTRIVTWGRDLFNTRFYVLMNELEASGVWSRNWKLTLKTAPHSAQNGRPRGS